MRRSYGARRFDGLDTIRGITLISMIAYHASWDLVYLYGVDWPFYRSFGAYLWQQSICWTFILLSGYCFHLGRHRLKRGVMAFGGGVLVSLVTVFAMPDSPIICGVLTLLGTATLLTIPLEGLLKKIPPKAGFAGSFVLFALLRNVNGGFLGFEGLTCWLCPSGCTATPSPPFWGSPTTDFTPLTIFRCCRGCSCSGQVTICTGCAGPTGAACICRR